MTQKNTNSAGLVIVAGVAISALVIGWFAFNRGGENLTATIGNETADAALATEQAADRTAHQVQDAIVDSATAAEQVVTRAEIRAELLALEARLEADAAYEGVAAELIELQETLAATYVNVSGATQSDWQRLELAFNQAVENIQSGTANALAEVNGLLQMLESDVRPSAGANVNTEANLSQ